MPTAQPLGSHLALSTRKWPCTDKRHKLDKSSPRGCLALKKIGLYQNYSCIPIHVRLNSSDAGPVYLIICCFAYLCLNFHCSLILHPNFPKYPGMKALLAHSSLKYGTYVTVHTICMAMYVPFTFVPTKPGYYYC